MGDQLGPVTIEGARIIFRNFAGRETPFNVAGERNFAVILDPQAAEMLHRDGWNVKTLKPREIEEGDIPEETPYLPVKVSYKNRPPRITLITSTGKTNLNEDSVESLDWADLSNVDLIVNPYEWTMPSGKSGIKAYLKTMFATLNEDDLERKYAFLEQEANR